MPDSLELPQGVQRLNNVSSLFIKSKFIEKELKKHRIRTIKKSFPEFSQSDTTFAIFEGRVVKQMDKSRIFSLSFYSDEEAKEAMQKLNELSGVLFAEPDYSELKPSIESFSITNDNMVSEQWHLNNTGQPDGTAGADISAFDAWNIFEGINENKIAIIGTGVDGNHPDLLGKVSGDGPDPNHLTLLGQVAYYHETGVAGMASAKIGGGSLRGIDSNAGIISKRIFNGLESGCSTFTPENCNAISIGFPAISNKINEAIIEGARTLNHSYSGPSNSNVLKEAFSNAYALNRVSVASMGNDGTSQIQYPAGYENYVIAVGNSDKFDNLSSSSNTGNHIDVVAPGTNVLTTWAENDLGHVRIVNGNSFSAPLVSGLANLLFGHSNNYIPNIANDDIKNLIRISADEVDNVPGFDNQFGYGRINAFQALKKLEPPYELLHFSSNSGGNIYSTSGFYYLKMLGVNGLADGTYRVKRIEVRKSVHFSYMDEVNVWGRGAFSDGFSDEDPNFGTGWVEPVSFSNSSATLRTYIYEVRHLIYNYLVGHFPTTANNVQFAYTVHGIPSTPPFSANISGPSYVSAPSSHTFTANGNSGVTPYTSYTWYRRPFNGSNWTQFSNNSSVNVMFSSFDSPGVEFKVAIQDSDNNIAEAVKLVHVTDDGGGCTDPTQPCLSGNASSDIPSEFNISQNFPNPFNPVTQIEFGVPENSAVTLKVYNIMGQEVVTLVNENLNAGNHRAQFDATSLSSGIYIAKINAVGVTGLSFVKTIKMNLIK